VFKRSVLLLIAGLAVVFLITFLNRKPTTPESTAQSTSQSTPPPAVVRVHGDTSTQPSSNQTGSTSPPTPTTVTPKQRESSGTVGVELPKNVEEILNLLALLLILAFIVEWGLKAFVFPMLRLLLSAIAWPPFALRRWLRKRRWSLFYAGCWILMLYFAMSARGMLRWRRPRPKEFLKPLESALALLVALLFLAFIDLRLFERLGFTRISPKLDLYLTAVVVATGTHAIRRLYDFLEGSSPKEKEPTSVEVKGDVNVHEQSADGSME
jgi:hypothetical protein